MRRLVNVFCFRFTTKRIFATAGCIWLISFTIPFIYFEVGAITYAFIFANTAIVLAIAITCFTFGLMIREFQHRARSDAPITFTNHNVEHQKSTTHAVGRNAQSQTAAKWERKVTKMFLVVLFALLCCYGPSTVFIYAMSFCESCSCTALHWFRDLQFLFVIMNSSVNFFCYALRSRRFRNAFAHILKIKRMREAEPVSNSGERFTHSSTDRIDTRI